MGAFPASVVERIGNVVAASVFGMRFDGHLATLNKHRVVLLGGGSIDVATFAAFLRLARFWCGFPSIESLLLRCLRPDRRACLLS